MDKEINEMVELIMSLSKNKVVGVDPSVNNPNLIICALNEEGFVDNLVNLNVSNIPGGSFNMPRIKIGTLNPATEHNDFLADWIKCNTNIKPTYEIKIDPPSFKPIKMLLHLDNQLKVFLSSIKKEEKPYLEYNLDHGLYDSDSIELIVSDVIVWSTPYGACLNAEFIPTNDYLNKVFNWINFGKIGPEPKQVNKQSHFFGYSCPPGIKSSGKVKLANAIKLN